MTATATTNGSCGAGGLVHEALLYHDDAQYVDGVTEFLEPAAAAGHPTLLAVPTDRLPFARVAVGGLGDQAEMVEIVDMAKAGRNPGRIISAVIARFAGRHPGPVSFVGEPIWPGRSTEEYAAAVEHEALINLAFADQDIRVLCPYDAARLSRQALQDAGRTHPVIAGPEGSAPSSGYLDPVQAAADAACMWEPAPPAAHLLRFEGFDSLRWVRHWVAERAEQAGVPIERIGEFRVAVNEIATNSLVHGGGLGLVRTWADRTHLVCEIQDTGRLTDPLVGRILAGSGPEAGRGLFIAHQLCDLVRIKSEPPTHHRPALDAPRSALISRAGDRHRCDLRGDRPVFGSVSGLVLPIRVRLTPPSRPEPVQVQRAMRRTACRRTVEGHDGHCGNA